MGDRILVLVQARMGSARLPGKALRPLAGRPLVLHALARAAAMGHPTWLVTSISDRDSLLAEAAREAGYRVWRGSEWDVLGRMAAAARAAEADTVVRVTGDCPLWAPDVGARVVALYRDHGASGYTSNDTTRTGWPDGTDTEVFPAGLLHAAAAAATDRMDREHVTPWMRRHGPNFSLASSEDWRTVKLSVDSPDDYTRVQGIMAELNGGGLEWPATRAAYERWVSGQ